MDDARIIIDGELALQRSEIRRDPAAVRALLHTDFAEIDPNGSRWEAEGVVAALATQQDYVPPTTSDLAVARLGEGVALLTYRDERRIHSSLWTREEDGQWLLRFHQQTPIVDQDQAVDLA